MAQPIYKDITKIKIKNGEDDEEKAKKSIDFLSSIIGSH